MSFDALPHRELAVLANSRHIPDRERARAHAPARSLAQADRCAGGGRSIPRRAARPPPCGLGVALPSLAIAPRVRDDAGVNDRRRWQRRRRRESQPRLLPPCWHRRRGQRDHCRHRGVRCGRRGWQGSRRRTRPCSAAVALCRRSVAPRREIRGGQNGRDVPRESLDGRGQAADLIVAAARPAPPRVRRG